MKIVPVKASFDVISQGRRTLRDYRYRLRGLRVSSRPSREYRTTDALIGKRRSHVQATTDDILAKAAKRLC